MKLDHLNIVIVFLLFVVSCSKEVQSNNLVEINIKSQRLILSF